MSTYAPGFLVIFQFLHHFVLAKLATILEAAYRLRVSGVSAVRPET